MAFRNYKCSDGVPAEVFLCVVSGTHSAGKSTTMEAFNDAAFIEEQAINPADPFNLAPSYGGSLLEATNIPIITGEEAMSAYARINRIEDLATSGYSLERQIAVEFLAQEIITHAMSTALDVATDLQPDETKRKGIVLVDRSALDGVPYSSLRTNNDQENIDVRQVELATIGWDTHPSAESRVWPLRKWSRDFMREYCDIAFISDHNEVPIEDNGFRQTDENFRDEIASLIEKYYIDVLGSKVKQLHGDITGRKSIVTDSFMSLVGN